MANDVDQDALAAEWGLALDGDSALPKAEIKEAPKPKAAAKAEPTSDDDLAAAWADAIEESTGKPAGGSGDGADDDVAANWAAMVDDSQAVQQESIEEVYSDHSMWFADIEERADDAIDRERLQGAIAEAIATLPEREAMVLQLYFVEEMNLEEIGQTLGVGAARICQIKKAALDRVRAALSEWA